MSIQDFAAIMMIVGLAVLLTHFVIWEANDAPDRKD